MGYIGNQTSNSYSSIAKQDLTGVTGSPVKRGFTLDNAVANAQEIEVFVNNVRQEPGVAYTVSGTALTMTGDVETTDDFYVVFQGKALQTTVPPDDSVTTARINDDAVTSAKIADGAVDTAQIAANAVTSAKMFSGFANGFSEIDVWSITANESITAQGSSVVTANWGRWATDWEKIGTGMTESSGIFTFPSTGKYWVKWATFFTTNGSRLYMGGKIDLSTDSGSSYTTRAALYNDGYTSGAHTSSTMEAFFDITSTSTHKVRFQREAHQTGALIGSTTQLSTHAVFMKLSDT